MPSSALLIVIISLGRVYTWHWRQNRSLYGRLCRLDMVNFVVSTVDKVEVDFVASVYAAYNMVWLEIFNMREKTDLWSAMSAEIYTRN